jgi:hypothetical protein
MLARPEATRDTRLTLLYNEEKLAEEKALFLGAFNYWQEDNELTFEDKLQRFRDLSVLNERSLAQTIHISLNFHPDDELRLTDKNMRKVAVEFMKAISFENQPWLLYRHLDAGHPHCHIVTINIRPDGNRIENDLRSTPSLARICAGLEEKYDLTPAGETDWQRRLRPDLSHRPPTAPPLDSFGRPAGAQRLTYGEFPTKTGITRVLDHVLENYNYTSLDHLNALLSLYHVRADRGSEHGRMYHNRGLYYRMIDDRGKKIGAPIKASSFPQRPILNYLEEKFEKNLLVRQQDLEQRLESRVRTEIDWTLVNYKPPSLQTLIKDLQKESITLVLPDKPGQGFFYVDFSNNAVHRDTDLGPQYTASAILQRTGLDRELEIFALQHVQILKPKDRSLLDPPNADPDKKLHLFLQLSDRHAQWAEHQQQQQQALDLQLHPDRRRGLSI